MKYISFSFFFLAILISFSCGTNQGKQTPVKIEFVDLSAEKKIDILADGKLFTSFCWYDNVYKPILYPVKTSAGTEITRGFPLNPKSGESTDHRHQVGIWLTYGNVNGLDFWGNGSEGKWGIRSGEIKHLNIEKMVVGSGEGSFITNESWIDSVGNELLAEKSEYHFIASGHVRIIDRITTLTATKDTVKFKDTKEGMFGIRVARQLQLSSQEDLVLKETNGGITTVKALANDDIDTPPLIERAMRHRRSKLCGEFECVEDRATVVRQFQTRLVTGHNQIADIEEVVHRDPRFVESMEESRRMEIRENTHATVVG